MYRVKKWKNVRTQSKYKNRPTDSNGVIYHSKLEAKYAQDLELRKKAGDIRDWSRQVRVELTAHGVRICNYYVDFCVFHKDDTVEWVEVKGFETDVWKLKWKLFEAQMKAEAPNDILTIVK